MEISKDNPNETRGAEAEEEITPMEDACPVCDMPHDQWTENHGLGYELKGTAYCCQGCAEGTGCICEKEFPSDPIGVPTRRSISQERK